MYKESISEEEKERVFEHYKRMIWWDFVMSSIKLFFKLFAVLIVLLLVELYFSFRHIDGYTIVLLFVVVYFGIIVTQFLQKNKKVKEILNVSNIHKVTGNFKVQGKDKDHFFSNLHFYKTHYYFRLFLVSENGHRIGISVTRSDYNRIKAGSILQITYFDSVNIPLEGYYGDTLLGDFDFFDIN